MTTFMISDQERAQFGRVAVLYGGSSAERSISLKSGAEVLKGLQRANVDAFGIDLCADGAEPLQQLQDAAFDLAFLDRKSPRLNSSHITISYAVFCLKKKKKTEIIDKKDCVYDGTKL